MCPAIIGSGLATLLQVAAVAGTTAAAAAQARAGRKDVERQNVRITARQKEILSDAQKSAAGAPITTGSGEDPARTLISEIKKAKAAEKLADEVGIATTPFNIAQTDKKSGTGLNL